MNRIRLGRSKVRVDELLQDAFHNITRRAQARDIRVALRVPATMTPVFAEKELLRIALDNLLENALRFTEQGGNIEAEAEETEHEILVSIRDDGVPIEAADRPHVFDRFIRTNAASRRRPDGLGLGLYLANEIVVLHSGRIVLSSAPASGNVFTMHLNKPALAVVAPNMWARSAVSTIDARSDRQTARVGMSMFGELGNVFGRARS